MDTTLQRFLSQIPTVFGQMVFVASLRDQSTGRYSHNLLNVVDGDDADRALCQIHYRIFSRWLTFGLEEQKKDLEAFLGVNGVSQAILNYPDLLPRALRDVERELYLTDLETVLELMRLERSAEFLSRES